MDNLRPEDLDFLANITRHLDAPTPARETPPPLPQRIKDAVKKAADEAVETSTRACLAFGHHLPCPIVKAGTSLNRLLGQWKQEDLNAWLHKMRHACRDEDRYHRHDDRLLVARQNAKLLRLRATYFVPGQYERYIGVASLNEMLCRFLAVDLSINILNIASIGATRLATQEAPFFHFHLTLLQEDEEVAA
jgi:hypothetical protein